jgi:hypothetical protein
MKTQNTLENKARFFAQYWGQHVLYFSSDFLRKIDYLTIVGIENDDYLELKPLSQITDEDAIEIVKLCFSFLDTDFNNIEITNTANKHFGFSFICTCVGGLTDEFQLDFGTINTLYNPKIICLNRVTSSKEYIVNILKMSDYLRTKGYALPWMDLSVEDLVEYGWVKLKES